MGFSVVCISSLQGNRTNVDIYIYIYICIYMYIYMELYFIYIYIYIYIYGTLLRGLNSIVRAEEFPWSEVGHLGKPCVACSVVSVMSDSLQPCGL